LVFLRRKSIELIMKTCQISWDPTTTWLNITKKWLIILANLLNTSGAASSPHIITNKILRCMKMKDSKKKASANPLIKSPIKIWKECRPMKGSLWITIRDQPLIHRFQPIHRKVYMRLGNQEHSHPFSHHYHFFRWEASTVQTSKSSLIIREMPQIVVQGLSNLFIRKWCHQFMLQWLLLEQIS